LGAKVGQQATMFLSGTDHFAYPTNDNEIQKLKE
jgi:hypothetical protein